MNRNSDPVQNFFLSDGWGDSSPTHFFKLLKLTKTSRARKLIFGLQVNIDKVNSLIFDVTR